MRKIITALLIGICIICFFGTTMPTYADEGTILSVSPMRESVVLNPGDVYYGSFFVSNPGYSVGELNYTTEIKPFYVNENYHPIFENENGTGKIAEWITILSGGDGILSPNETAKVEFKIDVPIDAAPGGQYAVINAVSYPKSVGGEGITISEGIAISHSLFVEVTGDTVISGGISDASVDSFVVNGKITARSVLENTGNVHGLATYSMTVYSALTNEEVYSNDGVEETHYVLPRRQFYNETVWRDVPMVGLFRVVYRVEFLGRMVEIDQMVVVCPIWLLILVIVLITVIILWIVTLIKMRKNKRTNRERQ